GADGGSDGRGGTPRFDPLLPPDRRMAAASRAGPDRRRLHHDDQLPVKVLVLDNYDSFTYNLAQYLGELGAEPEVFRADAIEPEEAAVRRYDRIVISPGPGRPEEAGNSIEFVRRFAGEVPILGVCLGHQAVVAAFGGRIDRAPEPRHGKTSRIRHDGRGVFTGLSDGFEATRYHSLAVVNIPEELEECAWSEDEV